jgi:hypothetical protein
MLYAQQLYNLVQAFSEDKHKIVLLNLVGIFAGGNGTQQLVPTLRGLIDLMSLSEADQDKLPIMQGLVNVIESELSGSE